MKFRSAFEAVDKIAETLEAEYRQGYFNDTEALSCADASSSQMEYNFLFKKKVGVACYKLVIKCLLNVPICIVVLLIVQYASSNEI